VAAAYRRIGGALLWRAGVLRCGGLLLRAAFGATLLGDQW
jgi:hypothetical protein